MDLTPQQTKVQGVNGTIDLTINRHKTGCKWVHGFDPTTDTSTGCKWNHGFDPTTDTRKRCKWDHEFDPTTDTCKCDHGFDYKYRV